MTRDEELYDRMVAGETYRPEGPAFRNRYNRAMDLQDEFNSLPSKDSAGRYRVLSELFGHVGENVEVRSPIYTDYGEHVSIGSRTFINFDCIFLDVCPITIGENCQIAPRVQFLTAQHPLEPTPRSQGWESGAPITIGNNVWIGAGTLVLPGVTIGDNSVIGAGSVVSRDIPANSVAVGSPARKTRDLPDDIEATDIVPAHLW